MKKSLHYLIVVFLSVFWVIPMSQSHTSKSHESLKSQMLKKHILEECKIMFKKRTNLTKTGKTYKITTLACNNAPYLRLYQSHPHVKQFQCNLQVPLLVQTYVDGIEHSYVNCNGGIINNSIGLIHDLRCYFLHSTRTSITLCCTMSYSTFHLCISSKFILGFNIIIQFISFNIL